METTAHKPFNTTFTFELLCRAQMVWLLLEAPNSLFGY